MDETPKKPWWRRRGWRIASTFWLASPLLYPLSEGPAYYGHARGWWRFPERFYAPVDAVQDSVQNDLSGGGPFLRYTVWWAEIGYAHSRTPSGPRP